MGRAWIARVPRLRGRGMAPGVNQTVVITIDGGSAIVYGVAIDNVTGNGTLQVARRTQE